MSKHTPGQDRAGAFVIWADGFRSAMPDVETAQKSAAAPQMLQLLKDYQKFYETYAMQDMEPNELLGELEADVFKSVIQRRDEIASVIAKAEGKE